MLPSRCFLITKLYCSPIFRTNSLSGILSLPGHKARKVGSLRFDPSVPGLEDEQGCQRAHSLRGRERPLRAGAGPSETNGEVFHLLVAPCRTRAPTQREPCITDACILLVRIFPDPGIRSPIPERLSAGALLRDSALGMF